MHYIQITAAFNHAAKLCRDSMAQQQPEAVQQLLQHLQRLAEQLLQQQCDTWGLANVIWSCGYLDSADIVRLLLPQLLQDSKLQQATPQGVANVLWSCATLGLQLAEGDVQRLLQRFVEVLPQANPQDVSNSLWACATLQAQLADDNVQQLVQRFKQVLPQAKPQEVANTLWACATLQAQLADGVVQQLVQRFEQVLPQANPQGVSNTLLACGHMQYAPLQLLSALDQQALPLKNFLAGAQPQEPANTAWACGKLGYKGRLLPGVLLQQAVQLLQGSSRDGFTMQELCSLCWFAAVLDLRQCVPQVLQLAAACKQMWATAVGEDLCQLYQVHLWLLDRQLPAPGQGLLGVLSQQQLQQCRDSWEQQLTEQASSTKASDLHRSVFAAVQALAAGTWQQPPVLEQRTADGAHSIDIAAKTMSGVQLAIEADGPSHFVRPNRTNDGGTLFRNRALAAQGYVLVSIP
jgi:hypothetical protein